MATASKTPTQRLQTAQAVASLAPVVRVNRTQISSFASVARVPGPSGINAPVNAITFLMNNASGGTLTYVIGDPDNLVAGNMGVVWSQPTGARNGSVAGLQQSFANNAITVKGINYTVSAAAQYDEPLMYMSGDRDGRFAGQPINIDAILRNSQYIATRQTIMFEEDYLIDSLHAFTLRVPTGVNVTMSLLLGGNMA